MLCILFFRISSFLFKIICDAGYSSTLFIYGLMSLNIVFYIIILKLNNLKGYILQDNI